MLLVSACLCGIKCRYDGGSNEISIITNLVKQGKAIPVCPEVLGGLPIPRTPAEIISDQNGSKNVVNKSGIDLTKEFTLGAEKALEIAEAANAKIAILKAKSPSCGCGLIYDGSFTGRKIPGNGLTAELLLKNNIKVYTEENISELNELFEKSGELRVESE